MAGNPTRKRKLFEQLLHALFVLLDIGIKLGVSTFEISIGHYARPAVSGSRDVDHVQIVFFDEPIEVRVDEIESGRSAKVSQQSRLDVLDLKRLAQKRVGVQINLSHGKVICRTPVGINLA